MQPSWWIFDASRHSWFESVPGYLPKLEMQLFLESSYSMSDLLFFWFRIREMCLYARYLYKKVREPHRIFTPCICLCYLLEEISHHGYLLKIKWKKIQKFLTNKCVNFTNWQMTTNIYIFLFWDMKRRKYHWSKQTIIFWLKSIVEIKWNKAEKEHLLKDYMFLRCISKKLTNLLSFDI